MAFELISPLNHEAHAELAHFEIIADDLKLNYFGFAWPTTTGLQHLTKLSAKVPIHILIILHAASHNIIVQHTGAQIP